MTQKGGERGNRATRVRWGAAGREIAGTDAVTIRFAVAEGEKWCCAAACVEGHCTTTVFVLRGACAQTHRHRAFPTAHTRFPTLDCPSDVCVCG